MLANDGPVRQRLESVASEVSKAVDKELQASPRGITVGKKKAQKTTYTPTAPGITRKLGSDVCYSFQP